VLHGRLVLAFHILRARADHRAHLSGSQHGTGLAFHVEVESEGCIRHQAHHWPDFPLHERITHSAAGFRIGGLDDVDRRRCPLLVK
jgi:hypothetical protein